MLKIVPFNWTWDKAVQAIRETYGIKGRIVPVEGYQACAVTDCGRVFTWKVTSRDRRGTLRELKQTKLKNGYLYVRIEGKFTTLVHRLLAKTFLPLPEPGQTLVRHLNGDPQDNDLNNLKWGTQKENMEDMVRHGRSQAGIKNPNVKLTERRVELIRGLMDEGFRGDVVAHLFGVSYKLVRSLARGEGWECLSRQQN